MTSLIPTRRSAEEEKEDEPLNKRQKLMHNTVEMQLSTDAVVATESDSSSEDLDDYDEDEDEDEDDESEDDEDEDEYEEENQEAEGTVDWRCTECGCKCWNTSAMGWHNPIFKGPLEQSMLECPRCRRIYFDQFSPCWKCKKTEYTECDIQGSIKCISCGAWAKDETTGRWFFYSRPFPHKRKLNVEEYTEASHELVRIARTGDPLVVKQFIDEKEIEDFWEFGSLREAVHYAVEAGHTEIFKIFLQANKHSWWSDFLNDLMEKALHNNQVDIVFCLIETQKVDLNRALCRASVHSRSHLFGPLIRAGATDWWPSFTKRINNKEAVLRLYDAGIDRALFEKHNPQFETWIQQAITQQVYNSTTTIPLDICKLIAQISPI